MIKKILNHPLPIALIGIAIIATIAWAVDWQDYGAFSGDIADTDDWLFRDISATPPANGTIKRLPWSQLKTQIGNGADFWTGTAQSYLSGEIVVNDEAGLYSALSDVNRFIEQNDADPEWGVNDTTAGHNKVYGNNAAAGGKTSWYNSANEDTTEQYFSAEAAGTELHIGPESDPDAIIISNNGVFNPDGNPQSEFYDTDAAGADLVDQLACAIRGNLTTTTEDAEYGDLYMECVINGAHTEIMRFDASAGEWTLSYPIDSSAAIEATSIDAGRLYENDVSAGQTETISSTICRKDFYVSDDFPITYTMPADVECVSGSSKEFCFMYRGADGGTDYIFIDPNASDQICLANSSCLTAGYRAYNSSDAKGDMICFRGRESATGSQYWIEYNSIGTWITAGS